MAYWRRYVSVGARQAKAARETEKLRKKGVDIQPVVIEGRTIARSFWGKGWCEHLESFSDYENRLPRGRTYARNGSVCHLAIGQGQIEALVAGSELYKVRIGITKLKPAAWKAIKDQCAGQIGSMLELLQGKLSDSVMSVVTDQAGGLFPKPREIELSCSCPDWATMCKHVASVLYGVGSRLDQQPDLLFLLRGVDAEELIAAEMALPGAAPDAADALADDQLSAIFGIDLEPAEAAPPPAPTPAPRKQPARNGAAMNGPAARKSSPKPRIRPTAKSVSRLRKRLGLTQQQFAEALGVSAASVYRWESLDGLLKLQTRCVAALDALHQKAK